MAGTQEYNVLWRRQFAYPIYRISHLDLNRDGLDELIVSTMYGVHVFQVMWYYYGSFFPFVLIQPKCFSPLDVAKYEKSKRAITGSVAICGRKQTTYLWACIGMAASKGNGESYCIRVTVKKEIPEEDHIWCLFRVSSSRKQHQGSPKKCAPEPFFFLLDNNNNNNTSWKTRNLEVYMVTHSHDKPCLKSK